MSGHVFISWSNTSNSACCFGDTLRCVAFSWSKHGASQSALASWFCKYWLNLWLECYKNKTKIKDFLWSFLDHKFTDRNEKHTWGRFSLYFSIIMPLAIPRQRSSKVSKSSFPINIFLSILIGIFVPILLKFTKSDKTKYFNALPISPSVPTGLFSSPSRCTKRCRIGNSIAW